MTHIPAMSRAQYVLISEVIKGLPPAWRNLVAWRFARALMGTSKGFNISEFITACGCENAPIREGITR